LRRCSSSTAADCSVVHMVKACCGCHHSTACRRSTCTRTGTPFLISLPSIRPARTLCPGESHRTRVVSRFCHRHTRRSFFQPQLRRRRAPLGQRLGNSFAILLVKPVYLADHRPQRWSTVVRRQQARLKSRNLCGFLLAWIRSQVCAGRTRRIGRSSIGRVGTRTTALLAGPARPSGNRLAGATRSLTSTRKLGVGQVM